MSDIVTLPDDRLHMNCEKIEVIDDEIRELVDKMLKNMYAASGCGLAAPQLGVTKRVVVIDVDWDDEQKNPFVLINPEIVEHSEEQMEGTEGCLSIPGVSVRVKRYRRVVVHAQNLEGELMRYESEGDLLAVCLQHEIDHLNGVLMIDHIPLRERMEALATCKAAQEAGCVPGDVDFDSSTEA